MNTDQPDLSERLHDLAAQLKGCDEGLASCMVMQDLADDIHAVLLEADAKIVEQFARLTLQLVEIQRLRRGRPMERITRDELANAIEKAGAHTAFTSVAKAVAYLREGFTESIDPSDVPRSQ